MNTFIERVKDEVLNNRPKSEVQQYARDVFLATARSSIRVGGTRIGAVGYNMEFGFDNTDDARVFSEILAVYEIFPKTRALQSAKTGVGQNFVVYVKSRECVCNLLALIGANRALMELNNEIVMRELRNTANRRANCDSHNIEKQASSSARQIQIIKSLQSSGRLDTMDEKLRTVAMTRIQNPEASMDELATLLGLSKSGVVHRLRKLCEHGDMV